MQITEISSEGLKRAYSIVVDAQTITAATDARLDKIKRTARMKGFRQGKVPVSLLKKLYGSEIRGEVLQQTLQETTKNALTERNLRPALQPKVDVVSFEENTNLEYKLEVELLPDISPVDFSAIKLQRQVAQITPEAIDKAVQQLAEGQRSFADKPEGAAAADGDVVVVNFEGTIDGELFDGGKSENVSIQIGKKRFIPGFEEQLIGAKKGEQKRLNVTFPEDYGSKQLAGKAALFDVTVHNVRAPETVIVNDEFAAGLGMENLEKLREAISERIGRDYKAISRSRLKRALLDELDKLHSFEVPSGMLAAEEAQIWQQFERDMQSRGRTLADEDKSEDELRAEYSAIADRRVRLGLLIAEVGRINDIIVNEEELRNAIMRQAAQFPGQEKLLFEYYQKNQQALMGLRAPIFEDKVVDFIVELAQVSEVTVSEEELLKEPDEEA